MKHVFPIVAIAASLALVACGSREESFAGYLQNARELYEAGDLVKAKLEVRNAVQLQPRNAEARYLLALISEQEQDLRGMLGNLQLALDADPDFVDAYVKLGSYYVVGRLPQESRETLDKALQLAPERADVRVLSTRVLLLEGDTDKAFDEAQLALSIDPANREAVSLAALLTARAGDIDGAMRILDEGIQAAAPADAQRLRGNRISILAEAGLPDRATAELEQLVADYPDMSSYQLELAELYLGRGRFDDAESLLRKMIAHEPDNPDWRIQLAGLLARQGRQDDAEVSLQQAVAEQPDLLSLQLALGGFYDSSGKPAEAMSVYAGVAEAAPRTKEGLAARNRMAVLNVGTNDDLAREIVAGVLIDVPDNVDALLLRAALRIQADELDDAISDLRLVLVRQPASTRALLGLARAEVLNGNTVLAEDTYRRVLMIEPVNAEASRELAVLVGNRGDAAEAETLLRRALRIEPDNPDASRNLVKALLVQQDFSGAEAEARRMLGQGEDSGVTDYQLGLALEAQQAPDQAIAAYKASLAKAPTVDAPLINLVRLLISSGQADEAEGYLKNHLEQNPAHLQARLLLAEVYLSQNQIDASEAIYQQVVAEHPDAVRAYLGLAGLYPAMSQQRLAALKEGYAKNPGNVELGLALGSTYEKRQNYEQAIQTYDDVLQATDNDIIANNLAALLLDFRTNPESFERALQIASRFEGREQRHPLNQAVLGWAYYRNGDYSKAARYLEQAVARAQQLPQLRYYLGMAYLKNDNLAGAQQELRIAVDAANKSGSTFTGLDEARAALQGLDESAGS